MTEAFLVQAANMAILPESEYQCWQTKIWILRAENQHSKWPPFLQ